MQNRAESILCHRVIGDKTHTIWILTGNHATNDKMRNWAKLIFLIIFIEINVYVKNGHFQLFFNDSVW